MKTFVMGDIHGAYKALEQCLEKSNFNNEEDTLIQLGDVADGFDEVYECVERLLQIKNLIAIKGNHDEWFNEFCIHGLHEQRWAQGGKGTAKSYLRQVGKEDRIQPRGGNGFITALNPGDIPEMHRHFFAQQYLYYIDDHNNCFVHGGFRRYLKFQGQQPSVYYWDRDLWSQALSFEATKRGIKRHIEFEIETEFSEIFIGHTSTIHWRTDQPVKAANIFNLDTGAGWGGRLTIMDIHTKQYWQSDLVSALYPNDDR